ncbi:MAG: 2-dehydropantoate 2-reductase, partial [Actinotalea sp.]|nr:2-dehydropantoate 2-reductase [Actinotalea sp.]
MRIAVVGAGGLGSKFAACLAEHAEVVVMHRRPEWVDAVNAHGLRMTRGGHDTYARVTATADPAGLSRAEVVLIAVKSYDSAAVADQL